MRASEPRDRRRPFPGLGPLSGPRRRQLIVGAVIAAIIAALAGVQAGRPASAQRTGRPAGSGTSAPGVPAGGGNATSASTTAARTTSGTSAGGTRPNIVFVLTDDLSFDLLRFMPHVRALAARGLSFANYFVSDSLCCPSRASIFTGNFPHDTGVFTNVGSDGGYSLFHRRGEERRSFNVVLQNAGYRTAMMGKYLNGYLQGGARGGVPGPYIPPGWNEWDVAGYGYNEFNYPLNENGVIHHFGHRPQAYLTDVLARRGAIFIQRSAAARTPFFLELATFAPHAPYTAARRYAHRFPRLRAPEPPNFDLVPTAAPRWLASHAPLTLTRIHRIDLAFRRRARSVLAVDDLIARLEATLAATGQARNTYLVFSSDNGYHTGEYRLSPGKLTAFDTDINVPLVVAGPGVPHGRRTTDVAQNTDLAKTFVALAGQTMAGDGHSLAPLFAGRPTPGWRNAALIEHHGPDVDRLDPDRQNFLSGNPTTYEAIRTPGYLYVEYADGEDEFYDLRSDPFELHNTVGGLSLPQLGQLHAELSALERCHDGTACWAASHVPPL